MVKSTAKNINCDSEPLKIHNKSSQQHAPVPLLLVVVVNALSSFLKEAICNAGSESLSCRKFLTCWETAGFCCNKQRSKWKNNQRFCLYWLKYCLSICYSAPLVAVICLCHSAEQIWREQVFAAAANSGMAA